MLIYLFQLVGRPRIRSYSPLLSGLFLSGSPNRLDACQENSFCWFPLRTFVAHMDSQNISWCGEISLLGALGIRQYPTPSQIETLTTFLKISLEWPGLDSSTLDFFLSWWALSKIETRLKIPLDNYYFFLVITGVISYFKLCKWPLYYNLLVLNITTRSSILYTENNR